MKTLIASDLHGSYACIKKLVKRIDSENPDQIIFCGDILYHGPRNELPSEYSTMDCMKLLNTKADKIVAVRGNCDSEADICQMDFDLSEEHRELEIDGIKFFITHGHFYNTGYLPPVSGFDILLHGHTHVPAFEKISNGKYYVNPGSVSIPRGGSDNSYLIFENKEFVWKDLDGNVYRKEKV